MKVLFPFIEEVSKYSDENLMTAGNLSIVFGPNLLRSEGPPLDMNELMEANQVMEKFILHHSVLLPEDA